MESLGAWYLRINPLISILTQIASRSIVLPLLITGLLFGTFAIFSGRFFCGFLCPLGAAIDVSDFLFFKKRKRKKYIGPQKLHALKYYLLIFITGSVIIGYTWPLLLDPMSIMTRITTIIFYPFAKQSQDTQFFTHLTYGTGSVLFILLIFAGGFINKRFFCQYICPTGAFLGLIGKFPFLKRYYKKEQCNDCMLCHTTCPTGAIDKKDPGKTFRSECIQCGLCASKKASCNYFKVSIFDSTDQVNVDISRRYLISSILLGSISGSLAHTELLLNVSKNSSFVRPPGSIPEAQFRARCIACQACIKACPGKIIQPSRITNGFSMLYTPIMFPSVGTCKPECTICGSVCPTQAIRQFTITEKKYIKIGTASVNRNRCLSWNQDKACLLCRNVCTYNAIETTEIPSSKAGISAPIVNETLCIGCGNCENVCPVNRPKAITISPYGENRRSKGSYLNEAMKSTIDSLRAKNNQPFKITPQADDSLDLFLDNIPEE